MTERTLHGLDSGLDPTGQMRWVGELAQGLACNSVCPAQAAAVALSSCVHLPRRSMAKRWAEKEPPP